MLPFEYATAKNASQAQLQSTDRSRFLAGGTTLIDLMKLHVETPETLIDVTELPWAQIKEDHQFIEVGAFVRNSEMAHHPAIKNQFPMLSEALLSGASVQLRNLATTGGNLLQRTRCSYFRDTSCPCNKRQPGSGCSAIKGYNRMQAVLGTSGQCIAAHASDMCVALMALNAKVRLQKGDRHQDVEIGDFYRVPGATPHIENILEKGDLIESVLIPKQAWLKNSTYVKIRDRSSYAFALTSAAVALEIRDHQIKNVRVALGGVGTIPWRSTEAEQSLLHQTPGLVAFQRAADLAMAQAQPQKDNAYKVGLAKQTLLRALQKVSGVA